MIYKAEAFWPKDIKISIGCKKIDEIISLFLFLN